jgi:hypothetical protein
VTESTPGGFPDTPGPDATPEQEVDVRALLAFLRDEPLEMPADVSARLDAVIAEERRTSARVVGLPTATGDPGDASPATHATVTVLPTLAQHRGPSLRTFKVVGGIAAAALVVVGGISLAGGFSRGSSSSSEASAASSSSAPQSAAGGQGTAITATGTQYTTTALATQAASLVAGRVAPAPQADSATSLAASTPTTTGTLTGADASGSPVAPESATGGPAKAFALERATSCVAGLTDGDGSSAIAIDSGTFNGTPALVVVVTDPEDPAALRVFVTKPDCPPSFLRFQRIARP